MPKSKPEPEVFRPEDSPILWFGEMLIALDRGDFADAAECQRELIRLGWRVARHKSSQAPRREGGGR